MYNKNLYDGNDIVMVKCIL